MKLKRLAGILALTMILTLFAGGGQSFAETEDSVNAQLSLIKSNLSQMLQTEENHPWYYSVMDFDHNGRLEFFAASQHPADRSTNLMIWEVNADRTALAECGIRLDWDESFPDIISDTADTYYNASADTWSYLFYDNIVLSPAEVYTVRCSVSLKDGVLGYQSYAVEHSTLVDSYRYVTYIDNNGNPISAEEYNSSGSDAFQGAERSTTSFEWLTAEDLKNPDCLTESYEIFSGTRPPTRKSPIVAPPVMEHDELQPAIGTAGQTNAMYMVITKNPTSEKKKVGSSLKFVAGANVYDSAYWTFVKPDGTEVDLDYFLAHFVHSDVDGYYTPVISIRNIDPYMDGWGAYCTFFFDGQTAVTNTAWITIRRR